MSQQGALLVMIGVVLVLVVLGVWAWMRRVRRDAAPLIAAGELPADATVLSSFDGLYVATTKHDTPLERIAAPGMAFRSRATVTVTDAGVVLDITGSHRIALPVDRLAAVGQSTVAIDRVVEPGGLTRLTWRTDAGDLVDTYFRPQDASARALADAIGEILTPTTTGTDA